MHGLDVNGVHASKADTVSGLWISVEGDFVKGYNGQSIPSIPSIQVIVPASGEMDQSVKLKGRPPRYHRHPDQRSF